MEPRTLTMEARTLAPGQRCDVCVLDVITGETTLVHSSSSVLFEAPNWTPDGRDLLVNGDGYLWRIPPRAVSPRRWTSGRRR